MTLKKKLNKQKLNTFITKFLEFKGCLAGVVSRGSEAHYKYEQLLYCREKHLQ